MSDKDKLITLIQDRWTITESEVTTSGGEQTKVYLDIPRVLGDRQALQVAIDSLGVHLTAHGLGRASTMIVGPLTGSIPLVMGYATSTFAAHDPNFKWGVIRDKPKSHGLGRWFAGAEPTADDKIILVDDVASTGDSLLTAYDTITYTGAEVLAVVPLVDRGTSATVKFAQKGVLYSPVLDYKDLGLPPLGAS